MPYYRQVGEIPRKRHVVFDDGAGSYFHEELMGIEGFSSSSALLYHRALAVGARGRRGGRPSNRRRSARTIPLLPRHLRTGELAVRAPTW